MRYNIDISKEVPCITKSNKSYASINKLEHDKNEDILYLANDEVIHLASDSHVHSRLFEYNDNELLELINKHRGNLEISLNDLKELRILEDILIHIKK
jgi:hypothetical protein